MKKKYNTTIHLIIVPMIIKYYIILVSYVLKIKNIIK